MKMRVEFMFEDMFTITKKLRSMEATLIRLIPRRYDKSNGRGRIGYIAVYMVK